MLRRLDYRSRRNAEQYRFNFDPLDCSHLVTMAGVIHHFGTNDDYDMTEDEAADLLHMVEAMALAEKGIQP